MYLPSKVLKMLLVMMMYRSSLSAVWLVVLLDGDHGDNNGQYTRQGEGANEASIKGGAGLKGDGLEQVNRVLWQPDWVSG